MGYSSFSYWLVRFYLVHAVYLQRAGVILTYLSSLFLFPAREIKYDIFCGPWPNETDLSTVCTGQLELLVAPLVRR